MISKGTHVRLTRYIQLAYLVLSVGYLFDVRTGRSSVGYEDVTCAGWEIIVVRASFL